MRATATTGYVIKLNEAVLGHNVTGSDQRLAGHSGASKCA
jgi:hypothetical protein